MRFKTLTPKQIDAIEAEVKMMLHASRDCYRNQKRDATKFTFLIADGYYGEAFGVMRGLQTLGYGSICVAGYPAELTNLHWWFSELQAKVLKEENFGGSGQCDYCVKRFGKDDAGRKREDLS